MKILRIYGKLLERECYPIPNTLKTGRRTRSKDDLKVPESLKSVTLHHVIRQEPSPFARKLKEYESAFKDQNVEQERELDLLVRKYKKVRDTLSLPFVLSRKFACVRKRSFDEICSPEAQHYRANSSFTSIYLQWKFTKSMPLLFYAR